MVEKLDKQFNIRITDEMERELEQLHGGNKREWFEKIIALAKAQSATDIAPDYAGDLRLIEIHTGKIFETVTHIVNRAVYTKDNAVSELTKQLGQKEAVLGEYQEKAKKALEELKTINEENELLRLNEVDYEEQIKGLRAAAETNNELIQQYKEKIDNLATLVNDYKGYAAENKELKEKHAAETEELVSRLTSETNNSAELRGQIQKLQYELREKELDKEKSLVQIERQFQTKLTTTNDEYTATIKGLYEEINTMRKEHEQELLVVRKEREDEIKEYLEQRKRYEDFAAKMKADLESNEQGKLGS